MMKRMGPLVLLVALGLLAVGCEWPHHRGGPASTGVSTDEVFIHAGNVGHLQKVATRTRNQALGLSPTVVVAGGVVYDDTGAWDEDLVDGCQATPKVCAPMWTYSPDGGVAFGPVTVADGLVYRSTSKEHPVGPSGNRRGGRLEAYDAAGVDNCGGAPKVCQPVWTGQIPTTVPDVGFVFSPWFGSPTVAGGRVYVTNLGGLEQGLYAFDAAGVDGCTPDGGGTPRCVPLFGSVPINSGTTPSVSDGRVFVVNDGAPSSTVPDLGPRELLAFDADGIDGCSGTPVVCEPLWRHPVGDRPTTLPDSTFGSTVPVVDSRVYAAIDGRLIRTRVDCTSGGAICDSAWSTDLGSTGDASELAIAATGDGRVLVPVDGRVWVYEPSTCLWLAGNCPPIAAFVGVGTSSLNGVTVANGVAFVTSSNGVSAFDLTFGAGCVREAGRPVCQPLWQDASGTGGVPAIVNGRVYAGNAVWALP